MDRSVRSPFLGGNDSDSVGAGYAVRDQVTGPNDQSSLFFEFLMSGLRKAQPSLSHPVA
jgi:hypothetical protein